MVAYPLAGSAARITWADSITWTITRALQAGHALPRTDLWREATRKRPRKWSASAIKTVRFPRTARAQARPLSSKSMCNSSNRRRLQRQRLLLVPVQLCTLGPLALAPASFRQAGNRDGPPKAGRTLWTTTHGPRPGLTPAGSSTFVCTVAKTAPMVSFSSNQYPSSARCQVDGKCVSRILLVCTLSTTTRRRPPGTTHAYLRLWTRMFRSTSAISGGS